MTPSASERAAEKIHLCMGNTIAEDAAIIESEYAELVKAAEEALEELRSRDHRVVGQDANGSWGKCMTCAVCKNLRSALARVKREEA